MVLKEPRRYDLDPTLYNTGLTILRTQGTTPIVGPCAGRWFCGSTYSLRISPVMRAYVPWSYAIIPATLAHVQSR